MQSWAGLQLANTNIRKYLDSSYINTYIRKHQYINRERQIKNG